MNLSGREPATPDPASGSPALRYFVPRGTNYRRSSSASLVWLGVLLLGLSLHAAPGSCTRTGPALFSAAETIVLTNQLAPLSSVSIQSLTESVPAGWTVIAVSGGGSYDAAEGSIRWLYLDNLVRELTYSLRAPASPGATVSFSGTASFDGEAIAVTGRSETSLRPPPSGTLSRNLPDTYQPGVDLTVTLTVTPEAGVETYGVTERFPTGWTASTPNHFGSVQSGQVRWGPFLDDTARTLSYTVTPPPGTTGAAAFTGSGSFDATEVAPTGDTSIIRQPDSTGTAVRDLPATYHSGESLTVTIALTPESAVNTYAVLETPPSGWTVGTISHFGSLQDGQVRWGPFLDADARTLTYQVTPPAGVGTIATFSGRAEFDATTVTATGDTQVTWASLENGTLTRSLPEFCEREVPCSITNRVVPNDQVVAYGVEEFLPSGWIPTNLGLASYQAATHSLRWGPFLDNETRDLIYGLIPPADASGTVILTGQGTFGAAVVGTIGQSNLTVQLPTGGTANRTLPTMFEPAVVFGVTNHVAPNVGVSLYVVDEYLPAGWTPINVNAGATFEPAARRLRWGPFTDNVTRDLTYEVVTPGSARSTHTIEGTVFFDESSIPIGGQSNTLANAAPELSSLADVEAFEDGPVIITFSASDDLTADNDLVVTATSSNPTLLLDANLLLGRIGSARSLSMYPVPERSGESTVTLTVQDGTYQTQASFLLRILATNDTPILYVPLGTSTPEDTALDLHEFTLVDADAASGELRLAARLTNGLVTFPTLGGSAVVGGANSSPQVVLQGTLAQLNTALATVRVTPDTNYNGVLPLTLIVDDRGNTGPDGARSVTNVIELTVTPVNDPPAAGALTVPAKAGRPAKIHATRVLDVAEDVDGDALRVSGVTSLSANGARVAIQGMWLIYEPTTTTTLPDIVTYQLTDEQATVTGTFLIEELPDNGGEGGNRVSLRLEGEDAVVEFVGIPNRTYRVQATATVGSAWQDLGTATADRFGRLQFTESGGAAHTIRYYRTRTP